MRKSTMRLPNRPEQTKINKHRRSLEAGNFGLRKKKWYYTCSENKEAGQLHSSDMSICNEYYYF